MARLHEYQGNTILAANGFKIPRGRAAATADEAVAGPRELVGSADAGDDEVAERFCQELARVNIGRRLCFLMI